MTLSWFSIIRLGLVQMCLGAIVVLTTSLTAMNFSSLTWWCSGGAVMVR